jgi:hypothetical protein
VLPALAIQSPLSGGYLRRVFFLRALFCRAFLRGADFRRRDGRLERRGRLRGRASGMERASGTSPTIMNGISSLKIGPVPAQEMVIDEVVTVSLMRSR